MSFEKYKYLIDLDNEKRWRIRKKHRERMKKGTESD